MNYLNIDHIAFKNNHQKRQAAKRLLFEAALAESEKFVIEFEKDELEKDEGKDYFYSVFPELLSVKKDAGGYAVAESLLDDNKSKFFLDAFSAGSQIQTDLFFNYVKTVRLLADDKTILRSGDHATFLLFDFTDVKKSELIKRFSDLAIPLDTIEEIEVDLERLHP